LETKAGDPFPERAVILMIVFIVILVTLVVQGLTLAPAVKLLRLPPDDGDVEEENRARLTAVEAALERLDAVADAEWSFDDSVERTRRGLTYRRNRFAARFDDGDDGGYEDRSSQWVRIQVELIEAQRDALQQLERDGTISSEVMRRVQRDLDLEEARLLS
jgi:CPA1 family monovalent cation:H+ antiporter